jgi:hypothetical protein
MKYAVVKGSVVMIYTKFHEDFFGQAWIHRQTDTQTHKQHDDLVSLLLFFQNKDLWGMLLCDAINKQVM